MDHDSWLKDPWQQYIYSMELYYKSNQNLYECSTMYIEQNRIFLRWLKVFWKVDIQIETVFVMWWVWIISDALTGFTI